MKHSFDYLGTTQFNGQIQVEDIGNCCLQMFNDRGLEWFLSIETHYGRSKIQMFGPLVYGINDLSKYGFTYNYQEREYKESSVINIINKFINDDKKSISQVMEIEEEVARNRLNEVFYANCQ